MIQAQMPIVDVGEMWKPKFFFFSSRRRHTRSLCDWSSDVCSSDLMATLLGPSLALESKRFHEIFGSDGELLEKTNARITKLRRLKDGTSDHGNTAGDPARSDAG